MDDFFVPSTWKRLFAHLADQLVILILFFPMWGFWYEMMDSEEVVFVPLSLFLFLLIFPLIYEFVFLAFFQRTPGKWLFGLSVVPRHDPHVRLRPVQALLRSLTNRLSLFFSWAPFALAFFRYDRTHVSDWVAETRVVQDSPRRLPPKIRWLTALVAIVFYSYQGFNDAIYMYDSIDFESQRVDIQEAFGSPLDEFDFDFPWDGGDDDE